MKKTANRMIVALAIATFLMSGCVSSDLEKLQGTWVGVEPGKEGQVKVIFSDDTIDFKGASPKEWYKGKAVLNEELTPKQVDFTISECSMKEYVGKLTKGIYKLEKNTLTLAGSEPGDESRPVSFEPSGGARVFQLKLQASD